MKEKQNEFSSGLMTWLYLQCKVVLVLSLSFNGFVVEIHYTAATRAASERRRLVPLSPMSV
jgi:hypothetical protein